MRITILFIDHKATLVGFQSQGVNSHTKAKLVVCKPLQTIRMYVVESRNRRDRLMALATPFDVILLLLFYYQSYLPPMATLMTWLKGSKLSL